MQRPIMIALAFALSLSAAGCQETADPTTMPAGTTTRTPAAHNAGVPDDAAPRSRGFADPTGVRDDSDVAGRTPEAEIRNR